MWHQISIPIELYVLFSVPPPPLFSYKSCVCCCSALDIVIAIDQSGSMFSVSSDVIDFVINLVAHLHMGATAAQVSIITFNNQAYLQFPLNQYTFNKLGLLSAISRMAFASGATDIAGALTFMKDVAFTWRNGDRYPAHRVGVVISDGFSNFTDTVTASQQTKDAGIELFAISNPLFLINTSA